MTGMKLTERQKQFAEENHRVLEDFLRYRGLPQEEFYDVVVFRFLRAVQQYDEREDLQRYSFQTIARNHMRSALSNYFRSQKHQKENMRLISLDYPMAGNPNLTLGDCIADERVNVCEEVCEKLSRELKRRRIYHISPYSVLQAKQGSRNAPTKCTFWEGGAATERAEAFAS